MFVSSIFSGRTSSYQQKSYETFFFQCHLPLIVGKVKRFDLSLSRHFDMGWL